MLTLALLITCAVFSVSASGEETPETIDLTTFKCPCSACTAARADDPDYVLPTESWVTSYTHTPAAGGHYYYYNKDVTPGSQSNITSGEVVIVLDNASLTFGGTGRALRVGGAATTKLHLIGNNATLTTKSSTTSNGPIAQIDGGATLNLYGDLTVEVHADATASTTASGLFRMAKGTLHIHDCDGMGLPTNDGPVLNASTLNGTATNDDIKKANVGGIALLEASTCTFIMDAGTLNGTSACYAGGVLYNNGGTITINGGIINASTTAGAVVNGGAIYVNGGTVDINGGTINGGAAASGGAIYVAAGTVTIGNDANYTNGATVNGGTATRADSAGGLGGAIYVESDCTVTMGTKGAIAGGTAWRGGCVYVKGTFQMNGGTISGGVSTNQGAQAFVGGTFNMTSGTVTANPDNTGSAAGFRVQNGKLNLSGDAVVITAGTKDTDGIDVVSTGSSNVAEVTLAGSATVKNQSSTTDGNNVINMQNYSGNRTKLTVKKGWSGEAGLTLNYLIGSTKNEDAQYQVGLVLDKDYAAAEGEFSGTLTLVSAPQQPPLIYNESGALQCCPIQLCTYDLPVLNARWFKSATEAAEAAQEGDYINICASGVTMNIGDKNVMVDFNGNDCTVIGTGKLYMLDAAGDEFGADIAKVTYNNVATSAVNPYNDRQYVALSNGDGTYSAHRIDLKISAVSVRPRSAGVYYTAELNCDDTLKAAFEAAGVAVSLDAVPGYDYTTKSLYTQIDTLTDPEFTGVLINEILKDGENNDQRGNMTIYANAYAQFNVDGQTVTVLADPYNQGLTKGNFLPGHNYTAYSLNDVMQALDLRWRKLDDASRQRVLEQLYNAYDGVMQDWNLRFIDSHVTGEPVKSLKVLTIGNSLSVDAGHMLGYICKIEGMESVRISTLYYGGCTQQQHANFLTSNSPEYRWYDTNIEDLQNTDVADVVPEVSLKKADQITMYEGIVMDDWDIIITQQGVWQAGMPETHEEDLDTVIAYVRKHATNPNAILMWNMIWAPPVEADMLAKSNNGIAPDASGFEDSYKAITGLDVVKDNVEAQNKMFELVRNAVQTKILTNSNFIDVIPAGTAQQNALWSGMKDSDMYRDYIHASDLSRYIYSYLWYCKLTDCDFNGVASDVVPLAVRYIKKDDISEIPAATEDLDLTATVDGYDYSLLDVVNHCISSALENPFTPKGIND